MTSRRKLILALAVIFALNMAAIALVQAARADTYERGDSGSTVREIQSVLKEWGYYDGSIDGIYGSATEAAVRYFQETNGLEVDGRTGPATLEALGLPTGSYQAGEDASGELALLARLISAESRTRVRSPLARWC